MLQSFYYFFSPLPPTVSLLIYAKKKKVLVFLCRLATGVGPLAAVFSAPLQRRLSRANHSNNFSAIRKVART